MSLGPGAEGLRLTASGSLGVRGVRLLGCWNLGGWGFGHLGHNGAKLITRSPSPLTGHLTQPQHP